MSIDWSKAPEGATHYFLGTTTSAWRDLSDENWRWWDSERGWQCDNAVGLNIDRSSKGLLARKGDRLVPRPPAASIWDGSGLPPVGTDLECGFACEDFGIWHKGVCIAVGEDPEGRQEFCVVTVGNKIAMYSEGGKRMRPIRTAEQIAAEEREATLTDIALLMGKDPERPMIREMAAILWDAGYRKQVQP